MGRTFEKLICHRDVLADTGVPNPAARIGVYRALGIEPILQHENH
jgi:hypothetical protein